MATYLLSGNVAGVSGASAQLIKSRLAFQSFCRALGKAGVWPYMLATSGELTSGYPWFDVPGAPNMNTPVYSLIFRPNDTSGATNVYTDWPTLYAARLLIQGAVQVELDGSLGQMNVPAGNYNLSGVSFISYQDQPQGYTLYFENGANGTIDFLVVNGANFRSNSLSPILTVSSLAFAAIAGSEISCSNANASFFHIVSGGTLSVTCTSEAVFGDTTQSTHEPVVKVDSGGSFVGALFTGTEFTNTVFDPTSSGSVNLFMDASVVVGTQTPVTMVTNLLDVANQVAYSAASAANWNNNKPTNVAAALDRIAAKIGPIS